jgi:dUTP pyrophosphatase
MSAIELRIMRLAHGADLPLPTHQSALASGIDLLAAVPADAPAVIQPGRWASIPTGSVVALPADCEGQVRPRSGFAARYGITVLNAPGTIDADYRGEVQVLLVNLGPGPITIRRGMRIAQLVVAPVVRTQIVEVDQLDVTARAAGGFGSTGTGEEPDPGLSGGR